MGLLRCFISIELPDDIKPIVSRVVEGLRASGADVRWVKEENLHLTLKFLGDTEEALIPDIGGKLTASAQKHGPFTLSIKGAGVFPNAKRPRVVWLGLEDSAGLLELQRDIDASLEGLGFEKESRGFDPHLTVGRVREGKGKDALLKEIALLGSEEFGSFRVEAVHLMQSELGPKGSRYTRLLEAPLSGRG